MRPLVQSVVQSANHLLGAEFASEILSHVMRYEKLLDKLRTAVSANDYRQVRRIQNRILRSYSARLACLVRSSTKGPSVTIGWMTKTAADLTPFEDCEEAVRCWAEAKASGNGWRALCSFGPKRKALQTLCGDIFAARFGTEPVNFLCRGRGAEIASDHLVSLVQAGAAFFVIADIKDFFGSVQSEKVRPFLGIPSSVYASCIGVSSEVPLTFVAGTYSVPQDVLDGAIRNGLPQGSRASQWIAGMLLGPVLRDIASADRIIVYGDDIAIAAGTHREAIALKKALLGKLESHPAGSFRLKQCEIAHVGDGFDFVKYHFRKDPFSEHVHRRPATKSYHRYETRVGDIVAATRIHEEPIANYRESWVQSFTRWRPNETSLDLLDIRNTSYGIAVGLKKRSMKAKIRLLSLNTTLYKQSKPTIIKIITDK